MLHWLFVKPAVNKFVSLFLRSAIIFSWFGKTRRQFFCLKIIAAVSFFLVKLASGKIQIELKVSDNEIIRKSDNMSIHK